MFSTLASGSLSYALPRHVLTAAVLLGLFTALGGAQTSAPPSVAGDLQRAEAALKANDQTTATQLFQGVLQRDPANAEAHANLGAIAFVHGDCAAAEPQLRAALERAPALTKVQALLSLCERRLGQPSATADMETAFSKLDDPRLHLQLGMELANGYYQQGDYEKTAAVLHNLLSTDPENVDVLFFAQRVYSELADTTLNKLAVLSPDSARMEQLIAERLINAGDLKDAAEHYRKALALSPKLPGVHYELAETLLEESPSSAGAQAEALRELKAARETDGDSANIEVQLGRIAALQANTVEAMAHYERACQLNPSDAQAQIGLADLYRQQEKPEQAMKYLRLAIQSDPLNSGAHYKLSQLDRQLHLPEESKKELQLFTEIRAAQDKVKQLYRQMNPQTLGADAASNAR